jgi:hypothetical protein
MGHALELNVSISSLAGITPKAAAQHLSNKPSNTLWAQRGPISSYMSEAGDWSKVESRITGPTAGSKNPVAGDESGDSPGLRPSAARLARVSNQLTKEKEKLASEIPRWSSFLQDDGCQSLSRKLKDWSSSGDFPNRSLDSPARRSRFSALPVGTTIQDQDRTLTLKGDRPRERCLDTWVTTK